MTIKHVNIEKWNVTVDKNDIHCNNCKIACIFVTCLVWYEIIVYVSIFQMTCLGFLDGVNYIIARYNLIIVYFSKGNFLKNSFI